MAKGPVKPTSLKVLEGNRSREKDLGKSEPQPNVGLGKIPDELDDQARKFWQKYAPVLERCGIATEIDSWSFASLCQIRSRLAQVRKFIKEANASLVQVTEKTSASGETYQEIKQSPYAQMERQLEDLALKLHKAFGTVPVGRNGMKVGTVKEDGLKDLLTK